MEPRRGGVCGQGGGGRRLVEHICHKWRGMLLSFHPSVSAPACTCNLHHGLGKKEGICLHVIGARPTEQTTNCANNRQSARELEHNGIVFHVDQPPFPYGVQVAVGSLWIWKLQLGLHCLLQESRFSSPHKKLFVVQLIVIKAIVRG